MKPQVMFYILLGLLGVIVAGGLAAYYFAHVQLAEKVDELEALRAETIVVSEEVQRLEELEEEYEQIAELEAKANNILPEEKRQSEVAAQIFTMIDNANMEGSRISFQNTDGIPDRTTQTDESSLDDVLVMPVNFSITGTYQELLIFLDNVERQERLMQVTSLSINRSSNEEDAGQLSLSIELEVFLKS